MYYPTLKRLFDIVAAAVAILALSPLLLVLTALIRIFDPGPALFRQPRTGKGGEEFILLKFRSMPVGTRIAASDELGEVQLSWIGKFLRRSNCDELPQLFNILRGDMSVVGPRPPLPSQLELIAERHKNGAIHCLPGLTGLAQINGYDGMPVPEKAAFDGRYAARITFLGDILIILKTFGYLLRPPPTY